MKQPINLHNFVVYSVLLYFAITHWCDIVPVKRDTFLRSHVFIMCAKRGGDQKKYLKMQMDAVTKCSARGVAGDGFRLLDSGCLQI